MFVSGFSSFCKCFRCVSWGFQGVQVVSSFFQIFSFFQVFMFFSFFQGFSRFSRLFKNIQGFVQLFQGFCLVTKLD